MTYFSAGITVYMLVCAFIFGAVFGSALNCLALRIVRHEKWGGKSRSKCPDCGHVLSPLDLIPVFSYIFLGGKCRYCKKKISPRYLIAEILLGVCFVFLALNAISGINAAFERSLSVQWLDSLTGAASAVSPETEFRISLIQYSSDFVFNAILASCLFALSLADLESFEIPDRFVIIPAVTRIIDVFLFGSRHYYFGSAPDHGLVYHLYVGDIAKWESWKEILLYTAIPLLSGLAVGLAFILLSLIMDKVLKKNSLGGGDIKLFAMVGTWVRPIVLLPMILLSCIIGLVTSIMAMKAADTAVTSDDEAGEKTEDVTEGVSAEDTSAEDISSEGTVGADPQSSDEEDEEDEVVPAGAFPFGPAISAAAFICLCWGDRLIDWYLKLTGIG